MNRKQFIQSVGADCDNWTWTWSFVNHKAKIVIFGTWQEFESLDPGLILSKSWVTSKKGRKQPGYGQSVQHISLVHDNQYKPYTYTMIADEISRADTVAPARIRKFIPELTLRKLITRPDGWYAGKQ